MRSSVLNITVLEAQKEQARPPRGRPRPVKTRAYACRLRNASASRLIDWRCRLDRCRRRRRAIERHPIDSIQHGIRSRSVLGVLVRVLLKQHDRHDLAIMLPAVEPVTYFINYQDDCFEGAVSRCLEDHLDASIGAAEALHVDAPLLLPFEAAHVRKLRDQRFWLTDRNEALIEHLVVVAEANVAVLERQRIDGPFAAFLGDGTPLPEYPSAVIFPALEQQHWQPSPTDDGRRVDVGERRLERRQGGKRTSRWRGGNLAPGPFVFAIIVGVIAVAIVLGIAHGCLPPQKALSASENVRASSPRPRTGTRTFSLRTSETPERREPMSSLGISRPRAFALSSTCLGERSSAFMTSS